MSSVKEIKVDLFCNLLEQLMGELSRLYPEDATLAFCLTMYSNLKGFYKDRIVEELLSIIKPYADKILQRDESFFLTEDFHEFKDDQFIVKEIEKIKTIWQDPKTSVETKESIWKYMISFVKIGKSLKMC